MVQCGMGEEDTYQDNSCSKLFNCTFRSSKCRDSDRRTEFRHVSDASFADIVIPEKADSLCLPEVIGLGKVQYAQSLPHWAQYHEDAYFVLKRGNLMLGGVNGAPSKAYTTSVPGQYSIPLAFKHLTVKEQA